MSRGVTAVLLVSSLLALPAALAQVAARPHIIGRWGGPNVPKGQPPLAFWGADLGWAVGFDVAGPAHTKGKYRYCSATPTTRSIPSAGDSFTTTTRRASSRSSHLRRAFRHSPS